MKMIDGSTYDGSWKDDVMHGFGKLTFKKTNQKDDKSVIFEGEFKNGL
jgi:hypothetical protein